MLDSERMRQRRGGRRLHCWEVERAGRRGKNKEGGKEADADGVLG